MVLKEVKQYILVILVGTAIFAHVAVDESVPSMSFEEKEELKEESRDMFYHAYRAYMENAYPADELMPLSCKGRWKDPLNSRGDLDDTLGNFSLTLIDSLDTLVILGDLEEFELAVKYVIKDVSFDQDVIVSVFETNIRVLGGLLSAHILAEYFQQRDGIMPWYKGELLFLAKDLGFRLLPAFNTTTGIPHSRVNLKHGLKNMSLSAHQETCTACAGTMILEMAALSRLTGEFIFEQKAHRAMDGLWKIRHRSSDLMGTVLNVQSGDWVRRDSGVGAGIDSYYEYCLKAYILLGDEKYLGRFNKHYSAIMKYISQGPMLIDVHMHRPHTNSKNFMDALLAFWPGLQVLKGDLKPAVETHEMLYQIMQRHNLIPEAFTTDFHVHWGQHPLRPEFVESTYFLYKATNDPYYLQVGKYALKSLQKYARVPCGYATIKDVRTGGHDDRMDSFVLAETFKYLYLLFADTNDLLIDLDEFLFTTEAHLLPLSLSRNHNLTSFALDEQFTDDMDGLNSEFARCCPNTLDLFPESVRKPLKNLVNGMCPRTSKRKLLASQFTAGDSEHLQLLKNMGIAVLSMADGRVQLVHTIASARSQADAKEGLLFMQEMLELSQTQKHVPDKGPLSVVFEKNGQMISIAAGPAHFGKDLSGGMRVTAKVGVADPIQACESLSNSDRLKGRIVIIQRGDCMFVSKVRKVEEAGAVAAIVIDNTPGSSLMTSSMFAMSGDGKNDVTIPAVFLFHEDASELMKAVEKNLGMEISITDGNNTGKS
uniref:alpha-1,2-Mannosidase n=1 Tax=Pediculus humanus subsp. corporis TaxID=121224 RepID=A0A1S4MY25_PEDHC